MSQKRTPRLGNDLRDLGEIKRVSGKAAYVCTDCLHGHIFHCGSETSAYASWFFLLSTKLINRHKKVTVKSRRKDYRAMRKHKRSRSKIWKVRITVFIGLWLVLKLSSGRKPVAPVWTLLLTELFAPQTLCLFTTWEFKENCTFIRRSFLSLRALTQPPPPPFRISKHPVICKTFSLPVYENKNKTPQKKSWQHFKSILSKYSTLNTC